MTLQEWKNKYSVENMRNEDSKAESSTGAGEKITLAQWMERYSVKSKYGMEESDAAGSRSTAGSERFRFELNKTPVQFDAPLAETKEAQRKDGYYSKPELWGDAERYEKFSVIGKAQVSAASAKAGESKKRMNGLYEEAEQLYASWQAYPSDATYARWKEVSSAYEAEVNAYNAYVTEYNEAESRYAAVTGAYKKYTSDEQSKYDAWRGTVRPQEQVQAERAAAELSIEALENRKGELSGSIIDSTKDTRGYAVDVSSHNAPITAEINEIDAQLKELYKKRDLLDEEYDWARYFGYEDMRSAADFVEKSKYKSTKTGEAALSFDKTHYATTGYADDTYEQINKNQDAIEKLGSRNVVSGLSAAGLDDRELSQMTDDEIAIFNYLYALDEESGDTKHTRAYEYVDYIISDLNYRQRQEEAKHWKQYAKEQPVKSSVFSALLAPAKGISAVGQTLDYAATGNIDENAGYNQ